MKRLVVGVFVSALTVFGVVPAASAATSDETAKVKVVKIVKVKKYKPGKIDWDSQAPKPGGGVTAQRIDWD
jgi:hypothetical protein